MGEVVSGVSNVRSDLGTAKSGLMRPGGVGWRVGGWVGGWAAGAVAGGWVAGAVAGGTVRRRLRRRPWGCGWEG